MKLYHYQQKTRAFLKARKHALLCDEMGVGKTPPAIVAAEECAKRGHILAICPAGVRDNFARELRRWLVRPTEIHVIEQLDEPVPPAGISVVSFEFAVRNKATLARNWEVIIVDEAHNLGSPDSQRAQAILGAEGLIHHSDRMWLLTGTPMPSHAGQLWTLLYPIAENLAMDYNEWIDTFCTGYQYAGRKTITGNVKGLAPLLQQIIRTSRVFLRRRKVDVMKELPAITHSDVLIEPYLDDALLLDAFPDWLLMGKREKLELKIKLEQDLLEKTLRDERFSQEGMNLLAALSKSVSSLYRYIGIQKIHGIAELIGGELGAKAYRQIVVFTIHKTVTEYLRQGLKRFNPVTIYGGTPPAKKAKNQETFLKNPKCQVLIANVKSGGEGINLAESGCHQVLFAEQSWIPGQVEQAFNRVHRPPAKVPVTVRYAALARSMDEQVVTYIRRKAASVENILDGVTEDAGMFAGETEDIYG